MPTDLIMVMRHAQKPSDKPRPRAGVREDGTPDPESLAVEGWQRAGALAALFGGPTERLTALGLARPDAVFASGHETGRIDDGGRGVKIGSHSRRPVETVTPIVRRLGLSPVTRHLRGEEPRLIADAKARDGAVLICWQHERIPAIGRLIIGRAGVTPDAWPDECYSDVWIFKRNSEGWDFHRLSLPLIETASSPERP